MNDEEAPSGGSNEGNMALKLLRSISSGFQIKPWFSVKTG